jgi:hypothetical protein
MMGGTAFALDLSADYRKLERNEPGEYQDACDITIRSKPISLHEPTPTNTHSATKLQPDI